MSFADGAILLDKPKGISSHSALGAAKRAFRGAKVGHSGTLDPFASGLLIVLVGRLTKLSDWIPNSTRHTRQSFASVPRPIPSIRKGRLSHRHPNLPARRLSGRCAVLWERSSRPYPHIRPSMSTANALIGGRGRESRLNCRNVQYTFEISRSWIGPLRISPHVFRCPQARIFVPSPAISAENVVRSRTSSHFAEPLSVRSPSNRRPREEMDSVATTCCRHMISCHGSPGSLEPLSIPTLRRRYETVDY